MGRIDDSDLVRREYASLDRLARRRLDVTGWVRGLDEFDTFLGAVAEVRPQRVLDAGAGRGDYAAVVAAAEVVCVDQSEAAVEAARARGLEAHVADIVELPFADGEFDVVICNHVLYHLPDRDRGIAELARVLRPGGRFVGIYNFRDHLGELWTAVGNPWTNQPDFDCETGGSELARHFARVECRPTSGSVVWLAREDLQSYLDAYSELLGPLAAPVSPYPFVARRHNCVLVANKADVRNPASQSRRRSGSQRKRTLPKARAKATDGSRESSRGSTRFNSSAMRSASSRSDARATAVE